MAEKKEKKTKDTVDSTKKEAADKVQETAETPKRKYTRKPKRNVWVQYLGKEYNEDELIDRALAQFVATEGTIPVKKITLYIKPEELAAYYVINDQYTGRVDF